MKLKTYRIFISHSYAHHEEYLRLVAMMDRAAKRDHKWRWENLSVPRNLPVMTDDEALQGDTYIAKMTQRKAQADVVLLILRREALDSEFVITEVSEAAPRGRSPVPNIGRLPLGEVLEDWNDAWGHATVHD